MIKRKKTKVVNIGGVKVGGSYPIAIQSMTNTDTFDVNATVKQILGLEKAGCEIIRIGVPDLKSAEAIKKIKKRIHIPLVADIHFNSKLALMAIESGADKIRINPGNFPKQDLKKIVKLSTEKKIPIRVGVNSGSLEKDLLKKYKDKATAQALAESALRSVKLLEDLKFYNIVISLKASNVLTTIKAYRIVSRKKNYPLHVGVTEAGRAEIGIVKSSLGIGMLLLDGIGDTIRVSLSGDPIDEIKIGFEILKSIEARDGVSIVSCPTCARTKINVEEIEKFLETIIPFELQRKNIKFAVMGCVVNGLGESKDADIGIVGIKKGQAAVFKKGKEILRIKKNALKSYLKKEIKKM